MKDKKILIKNFSFGFNSVTSLHEHEKIMDFILSFTLKKLKYLRYSLIKIE